MAKATKTLPFISREAVDSQQADGFPVSENVPRHCGAVNLFPGFSEVLAFICRECEEPSISPNYGSERQH